MDSSSGSSEPPERGTGIPGTGVPPVEAPVLLEPPEPATPAPEELSSPEEPTERAPPSTRNARFLWIEERRELLGWVLATSITVGVAVWIYWLMLAYPIPPGSDPGAWISISYAYIGKSYPGQATPYGYPPLLFPILGALVLATGSPLSTGHIIIPILITFLGLSTYALSRGILRSVLLSVAFLTILLLDTSFMALVFWGALPNLLAFSFMNLALLGLVWTGAGRLNRGTAFFWGFGAATVLTHSLAGVTLGAIVAVALILSMFVPVRLPKSGSIKALGDAPALLVRRLILSRPGFIGLLAFVASVGGWYAATAAARIAHPAYFTPGSATVHPATYGSFLRNLLPGLILSGVVEFYLLVCLVFVLFIVFGALASLRRHWLSTGLLILFGSWVAVPSLAIIGWLLSISTDYHRFGFFLVIPAGLTIALLIDRLWLGRGSRGDGHPEVSPRATKPEFRPFPPTLRATRRARSVFVAVVAVVLILILAGEAIPAYAHDVRANTGTTHDQLFVDAVNAIVHSGMPGSILTVSGNLKWTWALTDRPTYSPRPESAFLFYPVQITDSALSYYALTSWDALTNGLVSASINGTSLTSLNYAVGQAGGVTSTLRIPSQLIQVTLNRTDGTDFTVTGLNVSPTFQAPAGPGLPGVITWTEPLFVFQQSVLISPGVPTVLITSKVTATGPDDIVSFQEVAIGPVLVNVASTLTPPTPETAGGMFQWKTYGLRFSGLLTEGTVTPTPALWEATDNYSPPPGVLPPGTTNTGAAVLNFTYALAGSSVPLTSLSGTLSLTTPSAVSNVPNLPSVVNSSGLWQKFGVRFILIPNLISFPLYLGSFVYEEATYLEDQFGCTLYYSNSEWLVLLAPPSL